MNKNDLPIISDSALIKKLQDVAVKYFSNSTDMGLSVGIVKNGEVLFLIYGLTEKDGREITEHTLFQICSITKTFTGTILADLANQGLLSLDDPLNKYFDFPIAKFNDTEIRLVNLATHTSGLRDEYLGGDTKKLLKYLKSTKPVTEPGKVFEYSNIGMAVLGYIIEKITGKSYEQVVRENICDKIGMKNTVINLAEEQKKMCATPHLIEGNVTEVMTLGAMAAAGALISSTHDMVKYIAANLKQTGDQQLQEAVDTAQKIYWESGNSADLKRCLGWWWVDDTHEHGGGLPGYKSWLKLSRNFDTGVIILCNTGYNGGVLAGLASELLNIVK